MTSAAVRRLALSVLVLVAAALFAAACGGDDGGSSGGSSGGGTVDEARCGATKDDGQDIVRHCGDASGEITIDGKTQKFDEGACQNTPKSIVVNLGANVVSSDPSKADFKKYPYMGVLAGQHPAAGPGTPAVAKDGTFDKGVLVSAVANGKPIALPSAKLELTDGRTSGSFSGTGTEGQKVSGSFSCG